MKTLQDLLNEAALNAHQPNARWTRELQDAIDELQRLADATRQAALRVLELQKGT